MIRVEEILENQMIDLIDEVYANSGLGRWFGKGGEGSSSGGGWNRYNSSGKNVGKCGDAKKGSSYSACLGKKYVARLRSKGGKKAIANWVKRKKSAQNKAGRGEKGSGGKGKAPVKVSYKEQLCEIFIINHREQLKQDLIKFIQQEFQKDNTLNISILLDENLEKFEYLNFHPLRADASTSILHKDALKFMLSFNFNIKVVSF